MGKKNLLAPLNPNENDGWIAFSPFRSALRTNRRLIGLSGSRRRCLPASTGQRANTAHHQQNNEKKEKNTLTTKSTMTPSRFLGQHAARNRW